MQCTENEVNRKDIIKNVNPFKNLLKFHENQPFIPLCLPTFNKIYATRSNILHDSHAVIQDEMMHRAQKKLTIKAVSGSGQCI